jgi:transposase
MILLTSSSRILLAAQPAGFRRGIDGFVALCRDQLRQDPRGDTRFVFTNKSRTMVRVLCYDGSGFWLMTKRLSQGRFTRWPAAGSALTVLEAAQLRQWLRGPVEKLS